MRRPGGYAIVLDPGRSRPVEECDTFTCRHCNGVVFVDPLRPPSDAGGYCPACSGLMCRSCTDKREKGGACVTWERRMERAEARDRLLRAAGV